jgi:hypothetical protein
MANNQIKIQCVRINVYFFKWIRRMKQQKEQKETLCLFSRSASKTKQKRECVCVYNNKNTVLAPNMQISSLPETIPKFIEIFLLYRTLFCCCFIFCFSLFYNIWSQPFRGEKKFKMLIKKVNKGNKIFSLSLSIPLTFFFPLIKKSF